MERARKGSLLPYIKRCYIPVTHVLEYTTDWDTTGVIPTGCTKDLSEYGEDLDISSLSRLSGERAYIKILKHNRMTKVIDIL